MIRLLQFSAILILVGCTNQPQVEAERRCPTDCSRDPVEQPTCNPSTSDIKFNKCKGYYLIREGKFDKSSIVAGLLEWGEALGIEFIEAGENNPYDILIESHFYTAQEIEQFQANGCKEGVPLGSTLKSKAQIWFNDQLNWDGRNPDQDCQSRNLKALILHEMGHVFGLGHVNDESSLMYCRNTGFNTMLTNKEIEKAKERLQLNCDTKFKRTSDRHSWDESCMSCKCEEEFGEGYRLADWTEVKSYIKDQGYIEFYEMTGMVDYRDNGWVSWNGQEMYSSNRHYFIERHDGNVPGGWLVHEHIDGHTIDLGSWYNSRPILCYSP